VLHIDNYRHAQGKYRFTPAQVHTQHRFTTTNSYDANTGSHQHRFTTSIGSQPPTAMMQIYAAQVHLDA